MRTSIAAALIGLILARPAQAQTARIEGTVSDQTGAALPGVTIDLVGPDGNVTTVTDAAGRYQFDGVRSGSAELIYRLLNFGVLRRSVTIVGGDSLIVDATLILSLSADIVVTGARTFRNVAEIQNPAENLVGIAAAASQGAITAAQLEHRPIMRPGEVLEAVPGMIISQHSGEGKANQYYLRGFNLDHGTDFATTVAGVPVNTPTGAHAHGYSDVGFLIPELVSGVQFRKGPYFAEEGDFSAAGAANITYVNLLDSPFVHLSGGRDGWRRLVAAASPATGRGHLLAALELNHSDGPWERPDNFTKLNGVLRYSRGDSRNGVSMTGMSYAAEWDSTDQVPARAIESGRISRFGHIDETDGGRARRHSLAGELQRSLGASSIRATGYVLGSSLNLFSNFTYFLNDPDTGDQFEQAERRTAAGGRVTYRRLGRFLGRHTESAAGVQLRRDWLRPVGLYRTVRRERLSTTREDRVGLTMTGLHAQTEVEWTRRLRTMVGVRTDVYQFSVDSDTAENSGSGSSGLLSPKFGAVFGPWAGTEIYANAGMGFHSNDARGATIRVDPVTGEPADPVTPLVRARGAEVGLRTVRIPGVQSTVALWYLALASELLFVGDAGTTEAGRPSRRLGIEWSTYARPTPWLTVDGDLAFSRARFRDDDPAGRFIPGALDRVLGAGVSIDGGRGLAAGLRVRHFGPRPLVEDASVKSGGTTLYNSEVGWLMTPKARVGLEIFNLFDARVADIDYFYASRLPGEPLDGVADVHTHPALPRSVRLSLRVTF